MPLIEHLKELRHRLLVSAGVLTVGFCLGFGIAYPLMDVLTAPIHACFYKDPQNTADQWYWWMTGPVHMIVNPPTIVGELAINSPLEGVYMWFQVAFAGGALMAAPFVAWQMWQFVAPGLYHTERRVVLPLAFASSALFLIGALFCYAFLIPIALPFMLTAVTAKPVISIDEYLRTMTTMLGSFGLCFQLPVGVWFLARLGLIDHIDMWKGFRYAIPGSFVIGALLTPPEVTTQTMLALPLVGLYGASIAVAWAFTTKKRQ